MFSFCFIIKKVRSFVKQNLLLRNPPFTPNSEGGDICILPGSGVEDRAYIRGLGITVPHLWFMDYALSQPFSNLSSCMTFTGIAQSRPVTIRDLDLERVAS